MYLRFLFALSLLLTTISSCSSDEKKPKTVKTSHVNETVTCEQLWANMAPETDAKITLLKSVLDEKNKLSGENRRLLQRMLNQLEAEFDPENLGLIIDDPMFPIYRLGKDQIGIIRKNDPVEIDGRFETIAKEHEILQENFSYQCLDSMGILISFPEEFSELFNDSPPTINYYTASRKSRSRIKGLSFLDDECLTYFQYDLNLSKKQKEDSILFGSKLSLNLEFGSYPDIDKVLKSQYAEGCMDCPTNYPDQKTFAKLIGTEDVYFTYSDSFPVNTGLAAPSRSLIVKTKEGNVVTLWSSELDLSGCGCN